MNSVQLSKVSPIQGNLNLSNSKQNLNTTPNNLLTKTKHKENVSNKKMKIVNSQNFVSASGKNSKFTENSISTNFKQKRKYDQMENLTHQEEIITQTKYLIYKIDELYDKFSSRIFGKEWKEEFMFELKQENIVDTTEILPKSLNTRGSHLLEYTKFWILLIEYKFSELDLHETLIIFNNAILYEQNDFQLLYEYLVKTLEENFEKNEIFSLLEKKNGVNHFRVPDKLEELTREHYRFLLEKPEVFKDAKTVKNQYTFTPISSKAQKLLNEIQNLNSYSSKTVYHTNSNHKGNSLSKSKMAPTSIKINHIDDKQEENAALEEKVLLQGHSIETTQSMEKTSATEVVDIANYTVTTESKSIPTENCLTYAALVQRNKVELIVEITSRVDYVQGVDKKDEINVAQTINSGGDVDYRVNFDLNDKKLSVNIEANSINEKVYKSEAKYVEVLDEKEMSIKNEVNLKPNQEINVAKEAQIKKKKNKKKKKK